MACGDVGKVGTFCAFKVYTSLAGTSLSPTCTRVCVLVLHAYLAAISLTAEVPLPVVGGQVFVLVFHHSLLLWAAFFLIFFVITCSEEHDKFGVP